MGTAMKWRGLGEDPITEQRVISSFDGGVQALVGISKPDRYRYWDNSNSGTPTISRGAGLSLAAASFGENIISVSHENFDRIIGFDLSEKIVEVESGIQLFTLFNFLARKGLFLPVQPGHGQITIGGCVAADVHGKNHRRDGTFIEQVVSLKLYHPEYGIIELSRETNNDLFRLTCGGYGLTGHILSVKLRASPIVSYEVVSAVQSFDTLESGLARMVSRASTVDFIHSWHDFSLKGKRLGAGLLFESQFLTQPEYNVNQRFQDARTPRELKATGRFSGSRLLLNEISIRALNAVYRKVNSFGNSSKRIQLADAIFPIHKLQSYYYFLGNRGFHEYQVLLPSEVALDFLQQLGEVAQYFGVIITLASAKSFEGKQDLLRFSGNGVCFAVNFLQNSRSNELLEWLDRNIVEYGGRPNIIKDSRLPREVVEACYPDIDIFRTQLKDFDKNRLSKSAMSMRLGL